MLDELAELPGIAMITSVDVRNIFVYIEDNDISGFDVLVENFAGVHILESLNIAMVPYYSGVETDIIRLGNFDAVVDVTDMRYQMGTFVDSTDYTFTPDDTNSNNAINATGMWSLGYEGNGVKIGIVDSGINTAHEQFTGRIGAAQSFILTTYGYDVDDTSVEDVDGHGSHVSGIAAGSGSGNANAKGVAPAGILYMARVDASATLYSIAAGADWLAKTKGVDVINLSMGSSDGWDPAKDDIVEKAFKNLVRNYGVLFVLQMVMKVIKDGTHQVHHKLMI
jgi:subtilisin family serine protease